MRLVFMHGWAFDRHFWNPLAAALPACEKIFVDRGYFGATENPALEPERSILIGHSLGFVEGIIASTAWAGCIAINSFPRFVKNESGIGCVPAANLRAMKRQLQQDTQKALTDFYELAGAVHEPKTPQSQILANGLATLRDADVTGALNNLTQPTLILASANDPLVPLPTSEALGHTQHIHPTSGHLLPQSDAAWCAAAIKDFMQQHFSVAA